MTDAGIARRRLESQRIAATAFTRPDEVVAWLGAVQAQDFLGALWAVGLRLGDSRESNVERALADRAIVRTWPMRGTLHFLAAADARWMTELLAPRAAAAAASRMRSRGIDAPLLARARRLLARNLEGGRSLTRPAVYALLERAKIPTAGDRGLHVLWQLAHEGLLCFGPREGRQQTFVLFDEWLPRAKPLARDEALAELAARYFRGHGPATAADLAWWSGLAMADVRKAIALAGNRIEEETLGDRPYFSVTAIASRGAKRSPRSHVLPAFDEFVVGYADRSAAFDPAHVRRASSGSLLDAAVVIDGQIVGTWKRRIKGGEAVCSVKPFARLSEAQADLVDTALRRYAKFLGLGMRLEKVHA